MPLEIKFTSQTSMREHDDCVDKVVLTAVTKIDASGSIPLHELQILAVRLDSYVRSYMGLPNLYIKKHGGQEIKVVHSPRNRPHRTRWGCMAGAPVVIARENWDCQHVFGLAVTLYFDKGAYPGAAYREMSAPTPDEHPCERCETMVPEDEHCGEDGEYYCPDCYEPDPSELSLHGGDG